MSDAMALGTGRSAIGTRESVGDKEILRTNACRIKPMETKFKSMLEVPYSTAKEMHEHGHLCLFHYILCKPHWRGKAGSWLGKETAVPEGQ